MLVMSRKPGERLLIGASVEVTVLSVHGDQVRLGVSAPREIPIHRQELLDRIRRENRRAARLEAKDLKQMGASLRAQLAPPTSILATDPPHEPASPAPQTPTATQGAA
jgi:carbon storage regulator